MPNLSDLPNELLQMICERLQAGVAPLVPHLGGDSIRARIALARLCRTSTSFRIIAQPLLYRQLANITDAGILCFVRTAVEQPTLATYVQSISLTQNDFFHPLHVAPFDGPIRALVAKTPVILDDLWARTVRNFPDGATRRSRKDYANSKGTYNAVVTLCLAFLPNLRSIELTWPDLHYLFDGLARAAVKLPGFSKLETLVISYCYTEDSFSYLHDAPLLTLPSLRHIKLVANITASSLHELPFYSIAATRLTLEECGMSCEALLSLLRAFKGLKTLHFEVCSTNAGRHTESYPTPRDMVWALENGGQEESLTSLTVLLAENSEIWANGYAENTPLQITSLQSFTSLEHLEIQSIALIADESGSGDESDAGGDISVDQIYTRLPRSIQTLVIHSVDETTLLPMRGLAELCEDEFPHLKVIQICMKVVSSEKLIQQFKELSPQFKKASIEYSVLPYRLCENPACSDSNHATASNSAPGRRQEQ